MKEKIFISNWKMNGSINDFNLYLEKMKLASLKNKTVICPPFTYISFVANELLKSNICVGSQDVSHSKKPASTGEISVNMIKDCGAEYVIIGHSEARLLRNLSNDDINQKIKICLESDLSVIFCIGENLDDFIPNQADLKLKMQIISGLSEIENKYSNRVTIGYEPIWAIGSGKSAPLDYIKERSLFIKNTLDSINFQNTKILYGGSVNLDNCCQITSLDHIDGLLIGSASMNAENFINIINK